MRKINYLKSSVKYVVNRIRNMFGLYSPLMAFWEITNTCNAKCRYCNIWRLGPGLYPKEKELQTEECFSLIDFLSDIGVIILNLNGGDYLERKDLATILEHAKKRGIITVVNTNGLLLREKIKSIKDFTDFIFVLIDSKKEEVNDKIRGLKNSLKKTIDGIEEAKKYGLNIIVRTPVHKMNFKDLKKIAEFCIELNVKFSPQPLITVPVNFKDQSEVHEMKICRETYVELVKKLKSEYKNIFLSKSYIKFVNNGGFFNTKPCRAHKDLISIKPDGSIVFPCPFNPTIKFNNKKILKVKSFEIDDLYKEDCRGCLHSCCFSPSNLSEIISNVIR